MSDKRCPTCRSEDPKVRGHQHYGGGGFRGGRFCFTPHDEVTMQILAELVCRDPFHAEEPSDD